MANGAEAQLRERLEGARRERGMTMKELSVLSRQRDPYRMDTPSMHRDGAWLAEQIARLGVSLPIHLRGLHYALVATGNALTPDGRLYANTTEDWEWMSEDAAKAARWLGHVPFSSIIDNRNDAPTIYVPEESRAISAVSSLFDFDLPDPDDLRFVPELYGFSPRQPYRICLCGEKTSLAPILLPLAERYECEVVLPTGDMSDTLIHGIAFRAVQDERPLVVLYFADFDPSGWHMSVCIARKLQAFGDLMPGLPPVQVHRVAMNAEQVRKLGLPSTPLKETEVRADKWRARWDLEQTEIDALAQLRPQELTRIATEAIRPFFDRTLTRRRFAAERKWESEAAEIIDASTSDEWMLYKRAELDLLLSGLGSKLQSIRDELEQHASELDLPPAPKVEPDMDSLPSAPVPLFDSTDDWATATLRLVADSAHGCEEEP